MNQYKASKNLIETRGKTKEVYNLVHQKHLMAKDVKIDSGKSLVLAIDIQDKLTNGVQNSSHMMWNIDRVVRGAKVFGVKMVFSLQNPKRLGDITEKIKIDSLSKVYPKMSFSCVGSNEIIKEITSSNVKVVILIGVETHVCILQTALDLIKMNFKVFIVVDAISSRNQLDHDIALKRIEAIGGVLTTTESLLFEWCGDSSSKEFKEISSIIKQNFI